ncbi:MAG: 2-C-methyl-D-erythritol 4-phosphate cytidylyltransferase, partial [Boseongicola sp.]|nr:2-C-methyl-D-erythritol 4-phosphate cytidylyltransferase [Boseongicola sp.]
MSETHEKLAAAVIVAAGRGTRAGGDIAKQWQPLAGRRVIDWTLSAFRASPHIGEIVVVLHAEECDMLGHDDVTVVAGGDSRAASVRAGLEALVDIAPDIVLIHDGARACIPDRVIEDMTRMVEKYDAVAPGLAITDALWSSEGEGFRQVNATVDRSNLYRAQTPQAFRFSAILNAHRAHEGLALDDVEVARAAGMTVQIGPGNADNIKITTPEDFTRAERILKERQLMDIRVGNGFDVHRFGAGDHVILCGVKIPHTRGLQGHS